jgi:hypothetical protein
MHARLTRAMSSRVMPTRKKHSISRANPRKHVPDDPDTIGQSRVHSTRAYQCQMTTQSTFVEISGLFNLRGKRIVSSENQSRTNTLHAQCLQGHRSISAIAVLNNLSRQEYNSLGQFELTMNRVILRGTNQHADEKPSAEAIISNLHFVASEQHLATRKTP